jgi:putative flippase GtrA
MNETIANTIGYIISFCCNFLLTTYFTFKVKPNKKRAGGFAFSHLMNWGIQTLLLNFFLWVGMDKTWAPWPMFAISAPINFLFVRFFMKVKGK